MPPKLKTIIVEDQRLGIDLIRSLLTSDFELCGTAQTIAEGWGLFEEFKPDIAILDIELPDGSGLDLANRIIQSDCGTKVLGVSGKTDEYTLYQVFRTGFYGFVDKNTESIDELRTAIEEIAKGHCYYAAAVQQNQLLQKSDPKAFSKLLTEREQELLCHLGVGESNEAIAEKLSLRPVSVQNYRARIMKKLDLPNTVELIRYAIKKGFVNQWEFRSKKTGDSKNA